VSKQASKRLSFLWYCSTKKYLRDGSRHAPFLIVTTDAALVSWERILLCIY